MHELKIGENDLLAFLRPDTVLGALVYFVTFVLAALLLSRALRATVHAAMSRHGHIDRTLVNFIQQFGTALIWVMLLILYAHLIPVLRALGTALLTGASIASVVIGLAAQSTLGNLVAGVSITIYRPFRLGDTLQVAAPTGTETGVVETISLGYTTLRTPDGRSVVLPNSVAASQVAINLNTTFSPWPLSIMIHISRDADIESARQLACGVAAEVVGAKSVTGCFLVKAEASNAVLELKFVSPDSVSRDSLRSTLLLRLSQRFGETGLGAAGAERPAFS